MKRPFIVLVLLCIFAFVGCQTIAKQNNSTVITSPDKTKNAYPEKHWAKAKKPEDLGWSSEKLNLAKEYSKTLDTESFLLIEDGIIVTEWGNTNRKLNVRSVRKSLLSGLIGIAVDEKKIKLDSTMEELGIDDNEPKLTKEEKQARVSDLLKARSGVYHRAAYETAGMQRKRPKRGSHKRDEFWYYNNWGFNALGTIYEQSEKSTIFKEFDTRIAKPIQMEHFSLDDTRYFRESVSIHPAYIFELSARDLARYGLLFLRKGKWKDKQIISEKWVAESTKGYSSADGWGGYGYMWRTEWNERIWNHVKLPKGTFCAAGRGGQWLLVIPERKLVIVHNVDADISGRDVDGNQWGKLLALIFEAKNKKSYE